MNDDIVSFPPALKQSRAVEALMVARRVFRNIPDNAFVIAVHATANIFAQISPTQIIQQRKCKGISLYVVAIDELERFNNAQSDLEGDGSEVLGPTLKKLHASGVVCVLACARQCGHNVYAIRPLRSPTTRTK